MVAQVLLAGLYGGCANPTQQIQPITTVAATAEVPCPTPKLVYDYAKEIGVIFPEVVVAQSILESGEKYSSGLAHKGNNLFGMRPANQRVNCQIQDTSYAGYAMYEDWRESVECILHWQRHKNLSKHKSRTDYVMVGLASYAEDTTYRFRVLSKASDIHKKFGMVTN